MATVFNDLPGVRRKEIDLAGTLVPRLGNTVGTVIRSYKGPIKRPVVVTNAKDFVTVFGAPVCSISGYEVLKASGKKIVVPDYGYGSYAVMNVLDETASVIVVRGFDTAGGDKYSVAQAQLMALTGATSAFGISVLSANGVSGTQYVEGDPFDSDSYISSLDDAWDTQTTNVMYFGHTAPSTYGNNIAVTVERPSLSADWLYKYDGYPALSGSGDSISGIWNDSARVLANFPIASQMVKVSVYTKPTDKQWVDLYTTSADKASGSIRNAPVEVFYATLTDSKDAERNSLYIEDVINGKSNYIYAKFKQYDTASTSLRATSASTGFELPYGNDTNGYFVKYGALVPLGGGATKIGSGGGLDTTMWKIFNNRREVTVDIVLGHHWDDKKNAASVAASRLDCFAEVQSNSPDVYKVGSVLDNEQYGYTAPSYVGLNAGFARVYDSYNSKDVWLPNAIYATVVDLRTARLTKPWIAPAGTDRGIVSIDDQLIRYGDPELDQMASRNINPIAFEKGYGFVIWGQRTAQLKKSALDRKNVRFNLLYIENNIEVALKKFVFENNTQQTRMRAFDEIDAFLGGVKAGGGLYDYTVICDESNNPPDVIDANQLNLDIYVQPVKTAEIINFTTVVTKTGASLNTVQLQYV